uniref:O-methyltransferase dimerisation domain-containing protein n=1 Tax=Aegilops tauschii subsp. strangulata TaxID=200361 RepID=A0A453FIZ1_AEGTS
MDANRDSSLATGDELLQAQAELWNHVFAYTKSMSLRCAVELGIPDAVHRRGGSITVLDLVAELSLPPSRTPYLRRLMRLLAHAGQGLSPFALAMLHPIVVSPSMSLAAWFRAADDAARVPFATAHGGREFYAVAKENPEFGAAFNDAMACDGRFV